MLSSGMICYHLELMLSSGTKCYHLGWYVIIWSLCYHLGWNVIIWDEMISSGANVIIWDDMKSSGANVIVLQSEANVFIWCYHVMLSSGMITPPFFLFFLKTSLTRSILCRPLKCWYNFAPIYLLTEFLFVPSWVLGPDFRLVGTSEVIFKKMNEWVNEPFINIFHRVPPC